MFIFSNADGTTATWRFLYSNLCIELLRQRQAYLESCYIHEKQSGRASTIPLDVYLFPTQTARLPQGVFSTRICTLNRSASVKPIRKAATSHAKQKRQGFHPYRLMFIFCQRRQHDCHRAFSLPEFVRRIAPPMRTHEK